MKCEQELLGKEEQKEALCKQNDMYKGPEALQLIS